jgi:hypothetical protein
MIAPLMSIHNGGVGGRGISKMPPENSVTEVRSRVLIFARSYRRHGNRILPESEVLTLWLTAYVGSKQLLYHVVETNSLVIQNELI